MSTPDDDGEIYQHEESEPAHAVIFPWFTEALGLVVFFLLSRTFEALPYTAVLFVIGNGDWGDERRLFRPTI